MAFAIQHDGRNVRLPAIGHGETTGAVYRPARLVGSSYRPLSLGRAGYANSSSEAAGEPASGKTGATAPERRLPRTAPHASGRRLMLSAVPANRLLMADGPHRGESAGRGGRAYQGWPGPARADGAPPVLDLGFDSGTLQTARARVRACVSHTGFPEDRVEDVVLAVHELAANAVCHGGGAGRLRIWNLAGALYCQVDDGDLLASAAAAKPKGSPDQVSLNSLPCEPGHGLWVVQQVSDQMQSVSGHGGTSVLIRFDRGATRDFA
jgi:anti-sigma regulatory factor (Ser/Thr protein kinase)